VAAAGRGRARHLGRPAGGRRAARLSDAERKQAQAADGQWDAAHRRSRFTEAGDVVLVDTVARPRRQLTRTTAAEASPRFAARETAATFVRDNNLFRVPLVGEGDLEVQLTNVAPRKKEPKLTPSQQFLKDEERKLLKHVDEAAARKKRALASALGGFLLWHRLASVDSPGDGARAPVVAAFQTAGVTCYSPKPRSVRSSLARPIRSRSPCRPLYQSSHCFPSKIMYGL
jgi:hypothetical protein